jgi:hypothetical protein
VNHQPVNIEVIVHSSRHIESGERAVVDVSPLSLDPISASIVKPDSPRAFSATLLPAQALAQGSA